MCYAFQLLLGILVCRAYLAKRKVYPVPKDKLVVSYFFWLDRSVALKCSDASSSSSQRTPFFTLTGSAPMSLNKRAQESVRLSHKATVAVY